MAFWVPKNIVLHSEIWQSLPLWFGVFAIIFRKLFGILAIINSIANLSADMLGFPATLNSWFGDFSVRATLRLWK